MGRGGQSLGSPFLAVISYNPGRKPCRVTHLWSIQCSGQRGNDLHFVQGHNLTDFPVKQYKLTKKSTHNSLFVYLWSWGCNVEPGSDVSIACYLVIALIFVLFELPAAGKCCRLAGPDPTRLRRRPRHETCSCKTQLFSGTPFPFFWWLPH